MSRLCLDTSAYSQFKRGHESAVEAITRARWIGVPTIVLGELYTGFALGSRQNENMAELQRFLDNTVVQVIDVDAEVAKVYSEILIDLRQQGTPIPTNDLWIAASAMQHGLAVLTTDRHFLNVPQVLTVLIENSPKS